MARVPAWRAGRGHIYSLPLRWFREDGQRPSMMVTHVYGVEPDTRDIRYENGSDPQIAAAIQKLQDDSDLLHTS